MSEAAWPSCVLGEGIQLISGRHIQASGCNTDGFGMPYLTGPEDFPYHRIQATKFVSRPDAVCEPGDILLVVKGSGTGKMIRADKQYCISRQLMAIRSAIWSNCFLEHFIRACEEYFSSAASGLIPGISRIDILETPILIPPLPQQRKIARILTTLDNVITQTEALIAKYQAIKQGLMHDLFTRGVDATGKLRPPQSEAPELYKQSDLGWIPKEWEVRELSSMTELITKGATPTTYGFDFVDEGVRFIRGENLSRSGRYSIGDRWITADANNFLKRSMIHRDDVILGIVGTLGSFILVTSDLLPANISQNVALIRCQPQALSPAFLTAFFQTSEFICQIAAEVTVQAQPSINLGQVGELKILCPDVTEQQLIVDRLGSINEKLNTEMAFQGKLRVLKTGLMQDLLTGKVRVNAEV